VVGAAVAFAIGPHSFISAVPDEDYSRPVRWIAALLLGLMASGGSAFWNHALDIIGAVKTVKEQLADGPKTPAARPIALPMGP
jgi:drug/metabolite transporter (DMT)-like permease